MKESSCSQKVRKHTLSHTHTNIHLSIFFRVNITFLLLSQNSIIISQKITAHLGSQEGFLKLTELKKYQQRKKETQ